MLKLKLQYLAMWCEEPTHWKWLWWLGKIEGRKRRGRQRVKWLNGHEFEQTLRDSEGHRTWGTAVCGVTKSQDLVTELANSKALTNMFIGIFRKFPSVYLSNEFLCYCNYRNKKIHILFLSKTCVQYRISIRLATRKVLLLNSAKNNSALACIHLTFFLETIASLITYFIHIHVQNHWYFLFWNPLFFPALH